LGEFVIRTSTYVHCPDYELHLGDCLKVLTDLPDNYMDMVLADPPYGSTKCRWDTPLDLGVLWKELRRVVKPDGAIVLTASQPFTTALIASNYAMFKYCWVWEKTLATGHLNAKKMPMKAHEDVCVCYRKLSHYNPIKTTGHERKISTAHHRRNSKFTECYGNRSTEPSYDSTERYPRSVIKIATDKQKSTLHPTQKPVALMEYLVRTYTNPGDTVIDFTMGSGTTGIACLNLERAFIGIEIEPKYFDMACTRLKEQLKILEG